LREFDSAIAKFKAHENFLLPEASLQNFFYSCVTKTTQMKKQLLFCLALALPAFFPLQAQTIDTLAFQDFEINPASPVWAFTGPVVYKSGFSASNAAPPNSPLGIGGSRAWETTTVSSGLTLDFANTAIPTGVYDTLRVTFKVAAMNLNSSSGGPDHLDWILVSYSLDGGVNYTARIRIRGAANNNSFWPYTAQGQAKAYFLPATEAMFQPINSGLQLQDGIAHCELVFPGNIAQLALRITARSSSASDTWLIDNVVLTGERNCTNTTSTVTQSGCKAITFNGQTYTSSGTYTQVIPNAAGCDSIITLNLQVDTVDTGVSQFGLDLTAQANNANFQWIECPGINPLSGCADIAGATGATYTVSRNGAYAVAITQNGCTDTSAFIAINNVSDESFWMNGPAIKAMPNPASDHFVIDSPQRLIGREFQIVNQLGQVVATGKLHGVQTRLQVKDWPRGSYVILIHGFPKAERIVLL
jgi:hypothetical protein